MKEFILTQPYGSIEEMLNSGEMAVYVEELKEGNIESYAVVSRIGNRYDIQGNRIDGWVGNPFKASVEEISVVEEELKTEEISMKYVEIEAMIDAEVEKAVASLKEHYEDVLFKVGEEHAYEIANLKQSYEEAIAKAKAEAKAEILAKLSD